jgi:hypothetical protein
MEVWVAYLLEVGRSIWIVGILVWMMNQSKTPV